MYSGSVEIQAINNNNDNNMMMFMLVWCAYAEGVDYVSGNYEVWKE